MKLYPALLVWALTSAPVSASSPGMIEGPPGCKWEAQITSTAISSATDEIILTVMLEKEHGRCVSFVTPSDCGTAGTTVRIPVPGSDTAAYKHGQTLHVWVSGKTASLQHPGCTRTPIKH